VMISFYPFLHFKKLFPVLFVMLKRKTLSSLKGLCSSLLPPFCL